MFSLLSVILALFLSVTEIVPDRERLYLGGDAYCIADGINPLNGRALKNAGKIYTPAQNLSEQLAFEEAMLNDGSIIISAEDIRSYEWQGWDKMQYIYRNSNHLDISYLDYGHNSITVHYYQKTVNGITYKSGFKFKY